MKIFIGKFFKVGNLNILLTIKANTGGRKHLVQNRKARNFMRLFRNIAFFSIC